MVKNEGEMKSVTQKGSENYQNYGLIGENPKYLKRKLSTITDFYSKKSFNLLQIKSQSADKLLLLLFFKESRCWMSLIMRNKQTVGGFTLTNQLPLWSALTLVYLFIPLQFSLWFFLLRQRRSSDRMRQTIDCQGEDNNDRASLILFGELLLKYVTKHQPRRRRKKKSPKSFNHQSLNRSQFWHFFNSVLKV